MIYKTCPVCGEEKVPQNEIINVDDKQYCSKCFNARFKTEEHLEGKTVYVDPDPTVCSNCGKDNLSIPFEKVGDLPFCNSCIDIVKNRPFPNWIKASFAATILVVAFSLIWNFKYYEAFSELMNFYNTEEYEPAIASLNNAYSILPESEDIKALWSYYESLRLMEQDSSELAYAILKPYEFYFPDEFEVDYFLTQASVGIAFDSQNYPLFLELTQDVLNYFDQSAMAHLSVASAYAANYAVEGDLALEDSSRKFIQIALSLEEEGLEIDEYINRIEYRLYTRTVITTEEFNQLYPNGWQQ